MIQDALPNGRSLVSSEDTRASMEFVEHGQTEGRDLSWLDNVYNPRLSRDGSMISFTDQSRAEAASIPCTCARPTARLR